MRWAEWDHDKNCKGRKHHDEGRHPENKSVSLGGHDVFFEQELDGVGNGLQKSMRTNAHRAETYLHVSEDFALEPVHRDHGNGKSAEDQHDVDQRPEHISGSARRLLTGEVRLDVLDDLV